MAIGEECHLDSTVAVGSRAWQCGFLGAAPLSPPANGAAREGHTHEHHIWHVEKVRAVAADQDAADTFFCGGSRNFAESIDLFNTVFVLAVDLETLNRRLDERNRNSGEWRPTRADRERIELLHRTGEGVPYGIRIDATGPVGRVVDTILEVLALAPVGGPARSR